MARPKKNAAQAQDTLLTLDSVPEIPVEEQPYPLPEGWKWIYLKNAYEVTSSKRIHKSDWRDSGIPFYRTRELVKLSDYGHVKNDLFIDEELYEAIKIKFGVPKVDDILISGVGTIGVPYIIKDDAKFYFKDGNIIWLKSKHIFIPKFLFYLFKSPFINKQIYDMSSGTTVDTYTIINANKTKLPLPPLEVQQCIVDRIESLFAKLDEAREKAESALESFERRKAAILHKAFSGELTRTWRKIQQVSHAAWENKTFGTLVANSRLGLVRSKAEQGCQFKYKYLKMNNITSEGIISIKEITNVNASKQEVEQYELKYGDFIFNTRNSFELVGKSAVFNYYENNILYNNNIMRVNFIQNTNPFYINYFLYSPKGKFQLKKIKKNTTNVAAIYAKDLNLIKIPLASFIEQQEIVRILDRIFAREQQAREAAENVLQRIDQMKKAILARAFRGELG